jgi:trimeric autotransporter adhesin
MSKALEIAEIGNSLSVDGNGNLVFEAGVGITADVTGNADTATTLETARTINGVSFNGSANITVTATATNALTIGSYLTGSSYNGSSAITIAADATSANTGSKLVARDASGNFSAGAITASGLTIGAITLPATDGTNGQVLTTNGSGAVTFADAGGSALELYVENPSTPTAPQATGLNSVAIGQNSRAFGDETVSLGNALAYATAFRSVAIGYVAQISGDYSVSIGTNNIVAGNYAVGIAGSAGAHNSTAIGTNSANSHAVTATGTGAMALGGSYASGSNSFAAAIANHTSSYGATGANAVAIGQNAKATSSKGVAIGYGTLATANYGMAIGHECQAPHQESVALGTRSQTRSKAHFAFGTGALVSAGFAQAGMIVIHGRTGDATQGTLVSDSGLQSLGTAGNSNQLIVPSYGAIAFDGILVARGQGSIANTDSAAWKIEGLIRKESSNATTTLVNSAITVISNGPSWGIELSADTTNGALSVKVTGAASTNVKWVCTLRSSETLYNTY